MEMNDEAFEKFRLRLRSKVSYHLGAVCPDVEDLVQETLVRFLRFSKENKIRNPSNLGAFLNGVCNNVILEYRRRLWREEPYEPAIHEDCRTATPEIELREVREAIETGLAQLSDRDHAILRSFYLEERTRKENCEALGITDAHFRVALFRAKGRFRKIYHESLKRRTSGNH